MPIKVTSVLSGSSGVALLLECAGANILVDAGFPSAKQAREFLEKNSVDVVLASHLHQDHANPAALRELHAAGAHIMLPEEYSNHPAFNDLQELDTPPEVYTTGEVMSDWITGVHVVAVPMMHNPETTTHGFIVYEDADDNGVPGDAVAVMTEGAPGDAFFIYRERYAVKVLVVESNHDLELLQRLPNPNSQYHLSNDEVQYIVRSMLEIHPDLHTVLLTNISEDRNSPGLAKDSLRNHLREFNLLDGVRVVTAHRQKANRGIWTTPPAKNDGAPRPDAGGNHAAAEKEDGHEVTGEPDDYVDESLPF